MRRIRVEAEAWAINKEPVGAQDGPQDALRHAYWQCTLSKWYGVSQAVLWGDAHEKYDIDPDGARMDLWNNAAGRKVAGTHNSCEEGVLAARAQGFLKLAKTPPPTWTAPFTPPPPPQMDQ